MIRLGVNLDHAATLRAVRGHTTAYPYLDRLAEKVLEEGASHITLHLREDRRHVQDQDVFDLVDRFPLNLEMAATEEMTRIALKLRPQAVCLVPEKREELTTEGGLNVSGLKQNIGKTVKRLQDRGIEVSLFLAPDSQEIAAAHELGVEVVELHTGHWMSATKNEKLQYWNLLVSAAHQLQQLGMKVHAGHGLDEAGSLAIRELPYLAEVNIGHFIVAQSVEWGIATVIRRLLTLLNGPKVSAQALLEDAL